MELTVGAVLEGKVKSITNFGAFIALPENKTGMVHISEVATEFVKDIKDTLTGDKPIDAAGNEAPNGSYYPDREITWSTRRNK